MQTEEDVSRAEISPLDSYCLELQRKDLKGWCSKFLVYADTDKSITEHFFATTTRHCIHLHG